MINHEIRYYSFTDNQTHEYTCTCVCDTITKNQLFVSIWEVESNTLKKEFWGIWLDAYARAFSFLRVIKDIRTCKNPKCKEQQERLYKLYNSRINKAFKAKN